MPDLATAMSHSPNAAEGTHSDAPGDYVHRDEDELEPHTEPVRRAPVPPARPTARPPMTSRSPAPSRSDTKSQDSTEEDHEEEHAEESHEQ